MRYSLNLLTKWNHFGHIGGANPNFLFNLRKTIPAFTGKNEERQAHLIKGTASTLWELISDRRFEFANNNLLIKLVFLFRDAIDENEEVLFDGNYKWLHQIGEHYFFLPNLEWMFLLSYLQSMSLHRYIGITIGKISNHVDFPVDHSREILELLQGSMKQEFPIGETPKQVVTFISQFIEVKVNFPSLTFGR